VGNTYFEPGITTWPYADEHPYPAASWDPAEELAYLLRSQAAAEGSTFLAESGQGEPAEELSAAERLSGLAEITEELPRVRTVPGHRRVPERKPALSALQRVSYFIVAVAAVIVAMVSVLGGVITYDPLRSPPGARAAYGVDCLWPMLVYGPWMVASLSILRAALHRRRAAHSWLVVLFFSGVAMLLCIAQAPKSITGVATAALPALAALACFQQLVRQITLTRPPRRSVRRRRASAPPATVRLPQQKTST
jgi:hypothetical protein